MKAELLEIDGENGLVIDSKIITLTKLVKGRKDSNKRIIMLIQEGETRLSIKFEIKDGKIVNPKLLNVISSKNGLTLAKEL